MRFFVLVVLVLLTGCGPRYDTRYVYTAPVDSPETRQCLQSCEFQRQQCLLIADNSFQLCETQAQSDVYRCESEARFYYARCLDRNQDDPERCQIHRAFCPRRACWRDDRRCGDLYRACYAACGGTVRSETVCTANCQASP
jgi:hypothetical protein